MTMWQEANGLKDKLIAVRRDVHQHPETGWTEFRTSSFIIKELQFLGFSVFFGRDIFNEKYRLGVPEPECLADCQERAVREGADPKLVQAMTGGYTGVVAVLDTGKVGKTVAFRFDIDSNDAVETGDKIYRPAAEGFASEHSKAMHACGHDGHVAIGLGLARLLAAHRDELCGKVKLIFQPAEEGVRGAYAMVNAGVVDDVDYFFSGHIGFKATTDNTIIVRTDGFLATTKLNAEFRGVSAHAGAAPEDGKNALLAAAQAAISLNTIARHSGGASRINVGVLNAGTGRNVVPDYAELKLETRGENTEVNQFMVDEAERILRACAMMYDVELQTSIVGSAPSCVPDVELGQKVAELIKEKCDYAKVIEHASIGCSEDCSYFMERVQENGGRALFMMYGTQIAAGHHNDHFDFNEDCLWRAAAALGELALCFSKN